MKTREFIIATIIAFIGTICFFNVHSYWADQANANGLLRVVGGLCLTSVLIWFGYSYVKQGGNQKQR